MFTPEILGPIGSLLLLVALVYGMVQYKRRNRANDRITEKAAEAQRFSALRLKHRSAWDRARKK